MRVVVDKDEEGRDKLGFQFLGRTGHTKAGEVAGGSPESKRRSSPRPKLPSAARSQCRWRRSSFPTNVCEAGLAPGLRIFAGAVCTRAGRGLLRRRGRHERGCGPSPLPSPASMSASMSASTKFPSSAAAYFGGVKSALLSVSRSC